MLIRNHLNITIVSNIAFHHLSTLSAAKNKKRSNFGLFQYHSFLVKLYKQTLYRTGCVEVWRICSNEWELDVSWWSESQFTCVVSRITTIVGNGWLWIEHITSNPSSRKCGRWEENSVQFPRNNRIDRLKTAVSVSDVTRHIGRVIDRSTGTQRSWTCNIMHGISINKQLL